MILELTRFASGSDSTLGLLTVDGVFECFICEDEKRETKIAGETRIPAGVYPIELRREGGMLSRYQAKFGKTEHPGMLWLRNVPNFEFIYIHIGNDDDDTEGCLLTGTGARKGSDGGGTVQSSTDSYLELYRKILYPIGRGEPVYIIVRDNL